MNRSPFKLIEKFIVPSEHMLYPPYLTVSFPRFKVGKEKKKKLEFNSTLTLELRLTPA